MAAHAKAPKAPDPSTEGAGGPELSAAPPEVDDSGAPEPAAPAPAPQPVRRYAAPKPTPTRAGGHVLTERGWEIDTGQCDTPEE